MQNKLITIIITNYNVSNYDCNVIKIVMKRKWERRKKTTLKNKAFLSFQI